MDGLEDEEPFFTEEEIENILQEEPTEEEVQRNFSTIEPETENIFQEEQFDIPVDEAINNEPELTFEEGQLPDDMLKVSEEIQIEIPEDDERMNIIGQNGNEGLHYDNEEDTSSEQDDEKKKLEEFLIQISEGLKEESDLSIIKDTYPQEEIQILESTDYREEKLYWETDDVNPNLVIYDLENNKTIIPDSEEEIIPSSPVEKVISRNVSTKRRNFR
jgi:hypothetical protein